MLLGDKMYEGMVRLCHAEHLDWWSQGRFFMYLKKNIVVLMILFVVFFSAVQAQTVSTGAVNDLRRGISLFAEGRYLDALPIFDALYLDQNAGNLRAEAVYWSALTHIALNNYSAASKVIDIFVELFPRHDRLEELLYQQGRLHYLQQNYEQALQIMKAFLVLYPESGVSASALFWVAESLYELGRLPEAEKIYNGILEDYPDSVKAEAARYRIELIRFKYREEELLTLLKWSHEESLKVIEEFQRREKAYEQALNLYQKRYGDLQRTMPTSQAELEAELTTLRTQVSSLQQTIAARDRQIASLGTAAQASQPTQESSTVGSTTDRHLLELKERTLKLLAFYLDTLITKNLNTGAGR